jgi:peptidoglycan hydrolase-like protein with peptidoglycan-binding domain
VAPATAPSVPTAERQPVAGTDLQAVADDGTRLAIVDSVIVTQLQQKLQREGLYRGPIDGLATAEVAEALRGWKGQNGLGTDATIDRATANRLGLDWERIQTDASAKRGARDTADRAIDRAGQGKRDLGDK